MTQGRLPSQDFTRSGRPAAVVVRGGLNGLGVVRSLAQGGVTSYVVDTSALKPAMWSRTSHRVTVPALHGRAIIDSLVKLGRGLPEKPLLVLTDEAAVVAVSQAADELRPYYRFRTNSAELVERLENKARFQEFAERSDLPIPAGAVIGSRAGLDALGSLTPPFIIKPANKMMVYLGRTERLHRANTVAEARTIAEALVATIGEVVVQEWIPGPDSNILFCLFYQGGDGGAFRSFTGRKLLAQPPQVGSTAVCIAAPEMHSRLTAITRNFVRHTGYQGFGSLEFKVNDRTGAVQIVEPTVGRTDWQEEIATLSGVNLPLFAYELETGRTPTPSTPEAMIAWRANVAGLLGRIDGLAGHRIVNGYWRASDPLPALAYLLEALWRRTQTIFARAGSYRPRAPHMGAKAQ